LKSLCYDARSEKHKKNTLDVFVHSVMISRSTIQDFNAVECNVIHFH